MPWLVYGGAAILAYTAVAMLLDDPVLRPYYPHTAWFEWGTILVVMLGILGLGYWRNGGHVARLWVVGRCRHRRSRRRVPWPRLEHRAEFTMQDEHRDQRNSHTMIIVDRGDQGEGQTKNVHRQRLPERQVADPQTTYSQIQDSSADEQVKRREQALNE